MGGTFQGSQTQVKDCLASAHGDRESSLEQDLVLMPIQLCFKTNPRIMRIDNCPLDDRGTVEIPFMVDHTAQQG